jgi:hypothetical protein
MSHPNGVRGLSELLIVTSNLETDAPRYAKAAQAPSERQGDDWIIALPRGFRLTLISPVRYRERYGEQCVEADGRQSFFGAIVFNAPDSAHIRNLASPIAEMRVGMSNNALTLLIPSLHTLLEFRSPA